jgi:long-chain acyl-CoA synthetase
MRLEVVFEALAQRHPDKEALVCKGARMTYGELQASFQRVAAGLAALGLGPGDRIVLYLPNGAEIVQLFFGAFAIGATVVPVTTRLTARELAYFCEDCAPRLIVFHAGSAEAIADVTAGFAEDRRIVVGGDGSGDVPFERLTATEPAELPALPPVPDDCMIIYTSGTTGRPKGAVITHANNVFAHRYVHGLEWGISSDDTYLVTTPLAHRTGFARLGNAFTLGGKLVVMEKFEPEAAVETIAREGVTVAGMVPTVCRMLLPAIERDPKRCGSLRRLVVTGEAFPVELKMRLMELLPQVRLVSFFGMTEAGCVTHLRHEEQIDHPASVGRPIPGIEVKLVDDEGQPAPAGAVGEMLVRSGEPGRYMTMARYHNRPRETAETITGGWVRTGDLGRFDEEGFLYIVDRKKDMVLSGGFNIYTKEVEQALIAHDAVADAAVVGVPDPVFGEAVAAFVERAPGAAVTELELVEHCRSLIASYKKPKHVFFVEVLPRNALGKVLKADLRERANAAVEAL